MAAELHPAHRAGYGHLEPGSLTSLVGRFHAGHYVDIIGAEPGKRYMLDVDSVWTDVFQIGFKPITLVWNTRPEPEVRF